jgi:glycoprotein endo-alpha-1,2-mannosidase
VIASRRAFVGSLMTGAAGLAAGRVDLRARQLAPQTLAERFPDLARHFIFEYYPWYTTDPFRHWNEAGHRPPIDLASHYVPALGAYDSRSRRVMEQHARWIKAAGAGAINVSWWGRDSETDRVIPSLMDVMAAHDIRVTFHLEPYRDHHALAYADDIEYLVRKYGDGRRWDAFLLLRHADGAAGPVFKSFRTILPPTSVDCRGHVAGVADYTTDAVWRGQTDRVRATLGSQFDRITLLADSLDAGRTRACGFDGIAVYDNTVRPDLWRRHAEACSANDLVFSFNVNPGFDGVADRRADPGACPRPPAFEPDGTEYDWRVPQDRTFAARASERRIRESFDTTLALQTDPRLADWRRGFFLVYLNSFNEWHEGHQFEPMKDGAAITADERAVGYHNPADGGYRLRALGKLLGGVLNPR